jgi:tetratricopeptide (TPR) repeat protein
MSEPDQISQLQSELVRLRSRLLDLEASNASAQEIAATRRAIVDCKDALRSRGVAVADEADEGETAEIRQHTLTIAESAQVGVAVAGDVYGDIIYKLLPARVPRSPSAEEIVHGNELLGYMPVPPTEPPTEPRPFLLSGIFPLRHNPLFVGRDLMLQELAQRLKPVGAKAAISTGIGGVGKTTLAAEFAHRYGTFFTGGVFWISCADPSAIATQVANYGGPGGLEVWHPDEELSLEERVARVKRQWESELPRLVIFDNCDDWADATGELSAELILQDWMPHSGGCRVLVTSRRQEWSPALGVIDIFLDVLARPASITLLQSLASHLTNDEADRIAEAIGDLPLALYLAGGYLHRYRHVTSVDQFLTELMQIDPTQHRALRGEGTAYPPTRRYLQRARTKDEVQAELNVGRVFALSFDHLQADDPADSAAIALLARAACLAPGAPFARPLLLETLQNNEAEGRFIIVDGLERLIGLGMLEKQGDEDLRIHRLISGFALQTIDDKDAQEHVEQVVYDTSHARILQKRPAALLLLMPHLRHRYQQHRPHNDLRSAELALLLGRAEHEQINYPAAETLVQQSLQIFQQQLGHNHPSTAHSLNHLAELYRAQARFVEAEPLYQQALAIRHHQLGQDHDGTGQSLSNLAELYRVQGRYEEAEPLYQRALSIKQKQVGHEHSDTATILNNLALLYQAQGRYDEAEPLYQQAMEIRHKQIGDTHPDSATSLNNLAALFTVQGRYGEAERLYQETLTRREQQLGKAHPLTAQSLSNLALLYLKQGWYGKAEPLVQQALLIREQQLGSEHPDTALARNNLAELYRVQGRYREAEPLFLTALEQVVKGLGPDHPDTATSMNNLALLYEEQGRYREAESLFVKSLGIRHRRLGSEHPDTTQSLNNLASLYVAQKRYKEAEPLFVDVLATCQKQLGPDHPHTATSMNNLALLYQEQKRYKEAEPLFLNALRICQTQLGLDHPETGTSLNNLALLYEIQQRYLEAEPLFLQALALCRNHLGQHHPDTAQTANNLAHLYTTQGRYEEAELLFRDALAICEAVLPARHPLTTLVRANFAACRLQQSFAAVSSTVRRWFKRS